MFDLSVQYANVISVPQETMASSSDKVVLVDESTFRIEAEEQIAPEPLSNNVTVSNLANSPLSKSTITAAFVVTFDTRSGLRKLHYFVANVADTKQLISRFIFVGIDLCMKQGFNFFSHPRQHR